VENPRGDTGGEDPEGAHLIMEDPKVIRIPMMNAKPMTIEEAIKEMEALDFSFFVFNNAQSSALNVIYRRKEGFALIDPTLEA
jgi:putative sigma-54 modulation protein